MKSKKQKKPLNYYLLIAVMSFNTCIILGIRFIHSHLTETELFFKFWYVWLFCVTSIVITLKSIEGQK
jgi:hypothetical protein